jgi:hypothetical protein
MQTQNYPRIGSKKSSAKRLVPTVRNVFFMLCFFALGKPQSQAQSSPQTVIDPLIVVVNGGLFGGSDYANVGVYRLNTNTYTTIDTIYTNSAQDVHFEQPGNSTQIGYVAAQDSIIKYNFLNGTRLAAAKFGSVSTKCLHVAGTELLVGNWYGSSNNNLRIFDKNTLAYLDSVPEIATGVKDIIVVGDTAYIGQNTNDFSTNFQDSIGYISVIRISTRQWLYNDTLTTLGYDLGRMQRLGDSIVTINPVSNTISYYNIQTRQSNTVAAPAGVSLQNQGTGNNFYSKYKLDNSALDTIFMPFNNVIGSYNLSTNSIIEDSIVVHGQTTPFVESFAYVYEAVTDNFYVSKIYFADQASNIGVIYNAQGDSINTFPVGFSPEVLDYFWILGDNVTRQNTPQPIAKIYPNPTADILQIELTETAQTAQILVLCNTAGQVLLQQPHSQNTQISLAQYPAGMYWLQLRPADAPNKAAATWQRVVKY